MAGTVEIDWDNFGMFFCLPPPNPGCGRANERSSQSDTSVSTARRNEKKEWEILLPTVEMVINSMPNSSTGFSPYYLNYGHEPVMPIQLLCGNERVSTERVSTESVASFIQRVTSDWELARGNLKKSIEMQQKYYDKKT